MALKSTRAGMIYLPDSYATYPGAMIQFDTAKPALLLNRDPHYLGQ
jgi:hypothetical protein